MSLIRIECIFDEYDCEDCGTSWSNGFNVTIDFHVDVESSQKAMQFAEDIQNIVAGQIESKELHKALEDSCVNDIYAIDDDEYDIYNNLDQNN